MASAMAAVISLRTARQTLQRPIRILTVDAHQLVQEGLAAMINREEDMTVVATALSGEDALAAARWYRPDVVTLDLLLPDMAGEDLARRIMAELPATRIVAITSARDHAHTRALDAGVHGLLSRAASGSELVYAIRRVSAGRNAIPGPVACKAVDTR